MGVAAILVGQIGWILLAYWVRVETFIVHRERLQFLDPVLRSDVLVFGAPLVLSMLAMSLTAPRSARMGRLALYMFAVIFASLAEVMALLLAVNVWGS